MSDESANKPLLDPSSDASASMRALLASAEGDGLSSAQVEALAARLSLGAPVAPATIAPAATKASFTVAKLAAAVLTCAAAAALVRRSYVASHEHTRAPISAPPSAVALRPAPAANSAPTAPSTIVAPSPTSTIAPAIASNPSPRTRTLTAVRPSAAPRAEDLRGPHAAPVTGVGSAASTAIEALDPAEDVGLLHRAAAALRSGDTSDALGLLARHRRAFAESALGEERDRIEIEALVLGGRAVEARQRATSFRARYPRSAQQRRIDEIIAERGDASIGS
jgi:hypothetical protein